MPRIETLAVEEENVRAVDPPEAGETPEPGQAPEAVEAPGAGQEGADPAELMYLLVDPAWGGAEDQEGPPVEAIVGSWLPDAGGEVNRFLPNLAYEPSSPGLPLDPVDAALQLVANGDSDLEDLVARLPQVLLGIAVDEEENVVVAPAPDEVPSLLVTTSPGHRDRLEVPGWRDLTVGELADGAAQAGVDVLLNPGAPASVRLTTDALARFTTP
ncbi:type VII secretion system-associated protein [Saccharopolyspora sp. MS10]